MSGHSKWSKVKHQKAVEDVKRGQLFSKLAGEITAAARINPDIEGNPSLKAAIQKAREANVPKGNIERAIYRAQEEKVGKEESFILEVYAKGGEGVLIEGVTGNKNRALGEIRKILNKYQAKLVGPGGVSWNFEGDIPKTTKSASPDLRILLEELRQYPEVTRVVTDAV